MSSTAAARRAETEALRRHTRMKQRTLRKTMATELEENPNATLETIRDFAAENDGTFAQVSRPREAVLDMDNVGVLARAAARQVDQLQAGAIQFNLQHFLHALKKKAQNGDPSGEADWYRIGEAGQGLFLGGPVLNFLHGGLGRAEKVRKARSTERKVREKVAPVRQSQQMQAEKEGEEATAVRIKELAKRMEEIAEETGETTIGAFDLLVNPQSFTQTVENIFDFAFLVKDTKAGVAIDGNGLPVCQRVVVDKDQENYDAAVAADHATARTQNLFSINLKAYRDLVNAFEITESAMETRAHAEVLDWAEKQRLAREREIRASEHAQEGQASSSKSRKGKRARVRDAVKDSDDDDIEAFEENPVEASPAQRRKTRRR